MSKRGKILDLLTQNDLTTEEIHDKTGYNMDLIWPYISQFKKEGKIKKIGNKGRFPIYAATEKISHENNYNSELLDKLVLLMIKAGINSEKYDVKIVEKDIIPSINRLKESGLIG